MLSVSFNLEATKSSIFCDDANAYELLLISDWLYTELLCDSLFTEIFDSVFTLFSELGSVFIFTGTFIFTEKLSTPALLLAVDLCPLNPFLFFCAFVRCLTLQTFKIKAFHALGVCILKANSVLL